MLLTLTAFDQQRHSQWARPLPKQPKQLPAPLDVNILSASHLRHLRHLRQRLTLPPHPSFQQANLQLQVQTCIHSRRLAAHVINVDFHLSFLYSMLY